MNRVVKVEQRVIFGTLAAVVAELTASAVRATVNTVFVERHNGMGRNRNGRKARKAYCFSKDWQVHAAVSYFTLYSYNFCWPVRTLWQKDAEGKWQQRTPAMAEGRGREVAATDAGNGSGSDRSSVVPGGVAMLPGCSTQIGHDLFPYSR
jgi:hypothetical protein